MTPERRNIRAGRGPTLRCRNWRAESILRMLENTLENAEKPDELIIYSARAKAARNWECYDQIVDALLHLEENQTLALQSGKPVAVFPTSAHAPLVVMATSNIVPRWAQPEYFYDLERRGLIMWGGYTAGDWQYIGSQGIVQGTYQTFAAAAHEEFGGTLRGRFVVTAGLGGMGGAQPLAVTLLGGTILAVEVDRARIERRIREGFCNELSTDLDDALARLALARAAGTPLSIGLLGNAAEVIPELVTRGITPDIATDQTAAHDLRYGYIPIGVIPGDVERLREADVAAYEDRARTSIAAHVRALLSMRERGATVFEYGNNLREQAHRAGVSDAFQIDIFTKRYIRPLFCAGIGPFRWVAISGDASDIAYIDDLVEENFQSNPIVVDWIRLARTRVRSEGLPARIAWLGYGERAALGAMVNDAVARGDLKGPIAFTRDHLDSGSVAQPLRETEGMPDGSDAIADWPLLNALLNTAAQADLVAIHGGGIGYTGYRLSAGMTVIADGTAAAAERLEHSLTVDSGIGVVRYADAGYQTARDLAREKGIMMFDTPAKEAI
jgi:urocanate hydratase